MKRRGFPLQTLRFVRVLPVPSCKYSIMEQRNNPRTLKWMNEHGDCQTEMVSSLKNFPAIWQHSLDSDENWGDWNPRTFASLFPACVTHIQMVCPEFVFWLNEVSTRGPYSSFFEDRLTRCELDLEVRVLKLAALTRFSLITIDSTKNSFMTNGEYTQGVQLMCAVVKGREFTVSLPAEERQDFWFDVHEILQEIFGCVFPFRTQRFERVLMPLTMPDFCFKSGASVWFSDFGVHIDVGGSFFVSGDCILEMLMKFKFQFWDDLSLENPFQDFDKFVLESLGATTLSEFKWENKNPVDDEKKEQMFNFGGDVIFSGDFVSEWALPWEVSEFFFPNATASFSKKRERDE